MHVEHTTVGVSTPGVDASASYAITGGEVGRDRLRLLSSVFEATTGSLLDRVGIAEEARCLDAGCGGGDVTRMLAVRALAGRVVGVDRDAVKVASAAVDAPVNVDLRVEDLAHTVQTEDRYDVVYARFVLSHLADPARWVDALAQLVDPGGALVLEDIRMDGSFCAPTLEALDRSKAIYCATVRANGGDPNVGPYLPRVLAAAGLSDVQVTVVQPAAMTGATKRIWPLTMSAIREAAMAADVIGAAAIDAVIADLTEFTERADSVIAMPQVIQTWGRRQR
jgi:SAM-dependent methyltransferase